ncbi:LysR family transcriptional regulator [Actinomadura parmotrematis]|uniref:LysR family transcriptional regulator n=1 Tax=Actinomadura parmotrematis TaxID=2864039 RepID=A0ABS7FRS4_9ACTN|nr:LysR substrate-binding domain-containing protein [Actinomadura parmotrematis]MBW8482228.1 LysR family transcriptional regulator [Actinomadura parmotrematis]
MLSSRQLGYFQAVARELHFTRAAEALHIAQPALSQQVRKLERQLGVTLFDRSGHRVALTPAGAALLAHADRVLADLAAVEDEMLGWSTGLRGRLRLGVARGLVAQLTGLLADYCAAHPGVEVELREHNTDEMAAGVRDGRLDVATLAAAPERDGTLAEAPLGAEPLVLAVGPGTPLAGRARIAVRDLDGVDLVLFPRGSAISRLVRDALDAAGVHARERFESREYGTARSLAAAGLAAAFMPRSVAAAPGPAVAVLELDPAPVWRPVLVWSARRRPAPALAAFLEMARGRDLISGTSGREPDRILDD